MDTWSRCVTGITFPVHTDLVHWLAIMRRLVISPGMEKLFEIIFENKELLVINKPAGLVCHPTKTDEYSSLISRVRLHLGKEAHPQLVNRLDRETSGVTIVAKTVVAARQLRKIWEGREVEKTYLAIVHGHVQP